LRRRGHSSGDFIYYQQERAHLLTRLAEKTTEKQNQSSKESRQQRAASNSIRNMQMAREFLRERERSSKIKSPSALKAEIGKRCHDLGRSAAIEAINLGLESIKASGKKRCRKKLSGE
jgi:hypothetical protein